MDKRTTGIVAYITWIGLIIALVAGDKEGAKFHLNQALVLWLFMLLTPIPCLGQILLIFLIVCWVIGLIGAINEEEKEMPLIGSIKLIK
ncbi:hypothetical protein [Anaerosacchariphilus polymeriproducens]|uniref:DUF4870 domain-containing protein n=1 Tax=Anaerosacchariphilus polymeriproducens TaxID=1812858 RepID=A0A371AR21_9FIRM|nr:hypothetical protein [Anaerosacchariphilus polymeriproducens]RDU22035.1 hypothetical protein DWV06_16000 [Anaerosacchariphilus polymeriproducens]